MEDLVREAQYLEEKRRKLECLIQNRRQEALDLQERTAELALQLHRLEAQRADAQAAVSRLHAAAQSSQETLAQDQDRWLKEFQAREADLSQRQRESEAARAEQLHALRRDADAERLALQKVTE
eukprot:EG_transcript_44619